MKEVNPKVRSGSTGEKKPPGLPAVFEGLGRVYLACTQASPPPVRCENQKYAK